ncbi:MAG: hypothetical protein QM482_09180 [Sulfurospirillum sp.]
MKKGVALLITIGFVAVLTALIAYIFSLTNVVFDKVDNLHKRDQSSVIFSDVKKILDSYAGDIENSNDFSTFLLGVPPFYESSSGLGLDVKMSPLSDKININSILTGKKPDKNIVHFLQNICETYNILDASFFISLVLDTIDKDTLERQALSEISLHDLKYSNGRIYSKKQFETLEKYYADVVQDKNIFSVPWDRFVYFGGKNSGIVDCDRMSKEMIYILGLDSENFTGCDDLKDKESKKIATKYNLKKFSKENNYYILVKIFYQINSIKDRASFIYDIKTKRASNFELF